MRPLAVGRGACFATDRITVDGAGVGYCYREKPQTGIDSGWRFFAGDEQTARGGAGGRLDLYDVNVIANCDPGIVAVLDAPVGSVFAKDLKTGALIAQAKANKPRGGGRR